MTAAQSLKIYELLGRHFNSHEDARIFVTEIEQIIEDKIADKKEILASKEDIHGLKAEIAKLEKTMLSQQIDIEKRFNQLVVWIVGTSIAITGTIIAILKF